MKKYVALAMVVLLAASLAGCAAAQTPAIGLLYTNISGPLGATDSDQVPTKSGSATAKSILGLIATGDASIQAAAKAGGITKIHHVDYSNKSLLGLYANFTVTVYGN